VARHADAKKVEVALEEFPKHLILKIADDGKGFDASFSQNQKTLGILGMKERTSMIGGNYQIQSNIGKGTIVEVTVPYEIKPEEEQILIQ
jgi:signal transduction histidine kinase